MSRSTEIDPKKVTAAGKPFTIISMDMFFLNKIFSHLPMNNRQGC